MKTQYLVDVPTVDGDWDEVGAFDTREEAVKFVQEIYGGDENGMVALITECDLPSREDDEDEEV